MTTFNTVKIYSLFAVLFILCDSCVQGGIIARALFTVPTFDARLVHTIITQATPHQAPVIAADYFIQSFYDQVNDYWRQNVNTSLKAVTVVSTGGGFRDVLVRSHLTSLRGVRLACSAVKTAIDINSCLRHVASVQHFRGYLFIFSDRERQKCSFIKCKTISVVCTYAFACECVSLPKEQANYM